MRSFILGTDWWTDCDDAVALRLLTKYHKEKRINLLGIAINACMEHSVASLKGFLRADGVDIAVGIDRAATDFGGAPSYQKRLAADYGADLTNADAEDAVRLYRRILAEASEPIEIMTPDDRSHLANIKIETPSFHEWDGAGNNPEIIAVSKDTALLIYSDFYYPDDKGVKRKSILCREIKVLPGCPH